ncbi:MAG: hypothetical protein ACKVT1_16515 [Dehalococcoidia bacterium]
MHRTKLIVIAVAATLAVVSSLGVAFAGWCWSDPVIGVTAPGMKEVDVSIDVGVPDGAINKVSVVLITVTVPSNVEARVKFMDNKLPEEVTIVHSNEVWQPGQTVKFTSSVKVVASGPAFDVAHTITYTKDDGTTEVELKTGKSGDLITNEFGLFVKK